MNADTFIIRVEFELINIDTIRTLTRYEYNKNDGCTLRSTFVPQINKGVPIDTLPPPTTHNDAWFGG